MSGVNGINNVPMEYFLNGVAATDAAPSAPPEGLGADAVPTQDAVPKRPDAKSLVAQLDVLLLQAAASSTKGVGKKTAEALKKDLRAANLLSEAEAKLLMKCQEQAQKTFKALGKFTGKQLGAAFKVVDGRMALNASKGAGKACEAAIRAQNDLSDVLAQIGPRESARTHEGGMGRRTAQIAPGARGRAGAVPHASRASGRAYARAGAVCGAMRKGPPGGARTAGRKGKGGFSPSPPGEDSVSDRRGYPPRGVLWDGLRKFFLTPKRELVG